MAYVELYEPVLAVREAPTDPRVGALIRVAARLAELGLTPSYGKGDHGNLSCRTPAGCVISARETVKRTMRVGQFVEVLGVEQIYGRSGTTLSARTDV